jgi:TPR repeat protein
MRRYHEAATQRETEDDVKTELEKRTEVADARAYARILESARIGYAPAQFGAGIRALIGRGTEPDPTWAIDWLTKAANQNYVPAQRVLGFLHAKGIGTKQDLAKAYFWWTVATEAGDEVAKEGRELLNPLMTAQQLIEARKMVTQWKFIAAEAGFTQTDPAERRARAAELRQAAERGDVAQVRSLLTLGVDAQATDEGGKTALINAAWRGYGRVVEVMLEFGADPDFTDQNGLSALSWAALNGHTQVVEGLVAAGANINRRDNFGMTALMRAAWNGHRDTVAALVEAGADYTLTNNQRQSAIDLARSEGHVQIVELLQSRYRVRGGR